MPLLKFTGYEDATCEIVLCGEHGAETLCRQDQRLRILAIMSSLKALESTGG